MRPTILVFAIKKISPIGLCMDFTRGGEGAPYMMKVPCLYWAKDCFLVSKETLSREEPALPLNPLLALSTFLLEQQPSARHHSYCEDPTIKRLYETAFNLVYTPEAYRQNVQHTVDAIYPDTLYTPFTPTCAANKNGQSSPYKKWTTTRRSRKLYWMKTPRANRPKRSRFTRTICRWHRPRVQKDKPKPNELARLFSSGTTARSVVKVQHEGQFTGFQDVFL